MTVAARRSKRPRARADLPAAFTPQLATLVKAAPTGDAWLHETKFDGYRIGCRIDGRDIRLLSRNGKDWTAHFPEVRAAAARLRVRRALLDGEVAALLPDGRTSFQALQNASGGEQRPTIVYFVFDLLHLDGEEVARLPLEERKRRLRSVLASAGDSTLRYSDDVRGHGPEVFAHACRLGLEGVISKRRDCPYEPGRRGTWLKIKCLQRQEVVIGGFTDPEGTRAGIGALLVGVHGDGGALVFAGKVGTGFTQATARALRDRLERLEQRRCPFDPPPARALARVAHWVRPTLVAEVAFTEWTGEGKIRHPSFQGLRDDKSAKAVIREEPRATPAVRVAPASTATPAPTPARTPRRRASHAAEEVAGVALSHPERVLYPDDGISKRDLARFYEAIGDWIVPHLADRPLTLVRCPKGIGDGCFYMKHSHLWSPPALRRVRIREKTKVGEYLVADTLAAVVALVQMDVLEIHTWNSTVERVEQPDRIVLDLDPGPAVRWPRVVEAARLLRQALAACELTSFVKTTGGSGLHVVAPLIPELDWDACLAFSRGLAEAIVRSHPTGFTTAIPKAGRERKILIDYLRNNRTNTSVAAYSTRARPHAPVSTPLAWDELGARLRSDHFTVRNLGRRVAELRADPWKAYWTTRQRIPPNALTALSRS